MSFLGYSIDKKSPVPLYYQLKQTILTEIQDGNVIDGDILPTEDQYCEHYGISRTTVRQAVTELVKEGILYRVKGKGTFVSKSQKPITTNLTCMYSSFISGAQAEDKKAIMVVKSAQVIEATECIAKELEIKTGDQVLFIERFQKIEGEAFSYIKSYLRYPLCDQVLDTEKFERYSMYQILKSREETAVERVQRHIYARMPDSEVAELLNICEKDPLLIVYINGYSKKTKVPVIFEKVHYIGSKNKLIVEYEMDSDNF